MNIQEIARRLETAAKGPGKESGDPGPFLKAMKKGQKKLSEEAIAEAVRLGYLVGAIDVLAAGLKGGINKGAVKRRDFDELTDIFEVYADRNGDFFDDSNSEDYFEQMESGYTSALSQSKSIRSKFVNSI